MRPLSDREMDGITAGEVQPEPHRSETNGDKEILVANRSDASLDFKDQLSLSGTAQKNAAGVQLLNATLSNVVNLSNVADASGLRSIDQFNRMTQIEGRQGRLGAAVQLGPDLDESFSATQRTRLSQGLSISEIHQLSRRQRTFTEEIVRVGVPNFNPLKNFSIGLGSHQFADVSLGTITLGGLTGDPKTGLEATFGPVRILGPGIDLGSLDFSGDDLVVRPGSARLPGVDFGDIRVEACIVSACDGSTTHVGVIGGQTLASPIPDFTFPGANPFKDVDLKLGAGFAGAGEGSLKIEGITTTLSATFSLDVGALTGFDDVSKTSDGFFDFVGETLNVEIPTFDIPPIEVTATLPIDAQPGFEIAHFNGVVCVSVAPVNCDQASRTVEKGETRIDNRTESRNETLTFTENNESRSERSLRRPTRLLSADSEYIVFGDSALDLSVTHGIDIADETQQNLKGIHSVNTTVAVVGNALNASNTRSRSAAVSSGGTLGLRQSNVFIQQR